MTVPLLAKGLTAYLVIGLLLTIMGGPSASGLNNQLSAKFVNQSTGNLSDSFVSSLPNVDEESGDASTILTFIDSVSAVRNFIVLLASVGLAIPMVVLDLELPFVVLLLVGIPTTVLLLVGLAYFVRSGS